MPKGIHMYPKRIIKNPAIKSVFLSFLAFSIVMFFSIKYHFLTLPMELHIRISYS